MPLPRSPPSDPHGLVESPEPTLPTEQFPQVKSPQAARSSTNPPAQPSFHPTASVGPDGGSHITDSGRRTSARVGRFPDRAPRGPRSFQPRRSPVIKEISTPPTSSVPPTNQGTKPPPTPRNIWQSPEPEPDSPLPHAPSQQPTPEHKNFLPPTPTPENPLPTPQNNTTHTFHQDIQQNQNNISDLFTQQAHFERQATENINQLHHDIHTLKTHIADTRDILRQTSTAQAQESEERHNGLLSLISDTQTTIHQHIATAKHTESRLDVLQNTIGNLPNIAQIQALFSRLTPPTTTPPPPDTTTFGTSTDTLHMSHERSLHANGLVDGITIPGTPQTTSPDPRHLQEILADIHNLPLRGGTIEPARLRLGNLTAADIPKPPKPLTRQPAQNHTALTEYRRHLTTYLLDITPNLTPNTIHDAYSISDEFNDLFRRHGNAVVNDIEQHIALLPNAWGPNITNIPHPDVLTNRPSNIKRFLPHPAFHQVCDTISTTFADSIQDAYGIRTPPHFTPFQKFIFGHFHTRTFLDILGEEDVKQLRRQLIAQRFSLHNLRNQWNDWLEHYHIYASFGDDLDFLRQKAPHIIDLLLKELRQDNPHNRTARHIDDFLDDSGWDNASYLTTEQRLKILSHVVGLAITAPIKHHQPPNQPPNRGHPEPSPTYPPPRKHPNQPYKAPGPHLPTKAAGKGQHLRSHQTIQLSEGLTTGGPRTTTFPDKICATHLRGQPCSDSACKYGHDEAWKGRAAEFPCRQWMNDLCKHPNCKYLHDPDLRLQFQKLKKEHAATAHQTLLDTHGTFFDSSDDETPPRETTPHNIKEGPPPIALQTTATDLSTNHPVQTPPAIPAVPPPEYNPTCMQTTAPSLPGQAVTADDWTGDWDITLPPDIDYTDITTDGYPPACSFSLAAMTSILKDQPKLRDWLLDSCANIKCLPPTDPRVGKPTGQQVTLKCTDGFHRFPLHHCSDPFSKHTYCLAVPGCDPILPLDRATRFLDLQWNRRLGFILHDPDTKKNTPTYLQGGIPYLSATYEHPCSSNPTDPRDPPKAHLTQATHNPTYSSNTTDPPPSTPAAHIARTILHLNNPNNPSYSTDNPATTKHLIRALNTIFDPSQFFLVTGHPHITEDAPEPQITSFTSTINHTLLHLQPFP